MSVKFYLKVGDAEDVDDTTGFTDFEAAIGDITDWSGILTEGPIRGLLVEMDMLPGGQWVQGEAGVFSFDVPFVALRSDAECAPGDSDVDAWRAYGTGIPALKAFRGPTLVVAREFLDASGTVQLREQALAVLVNALPLTSNEGRSVDGVAVFQHLSGEWLEVAGS